MADPSDLKKRFFSDQSGGHKESHICQHSKHSDLFPDITPFLPPLGLLYKISKTY